MKYHQLQSVIKDEETNLANFWQRGIAFIIDLILILLLLAGVALILQGLGLNLKHLEFKTLSDVDVDVEGIGDHTTKFLKYGVASIPTLYFALFTYFSNGKTPGKWIMHIRIVSLYHHRISFWHCVERALGYVASGLELGLGFYQIFWNPNRMCLHDRIAETIVVKEKIKLKVKQVRK